MFAILHALGMLVADQFKSRSRLEAENLFLRHQLNIALRRAPPRFRLRGGDRALLIWMTQLWPSLINAAQVVQPETILRWHRAGFKVFWRWKSRHRAGRPKIDRGLRDLIRRMSKENPLWGASRIHGELLMLGSEVAQSTVSKYMVRGQNPPSQSWTTFLRNHAEAIAAIDLCVVPTLTFDLLFAFLVLGHGRRQLLWFEVTRHPTAEWLARQITEAFPWASAPAYLVRDNDRAYGHVFTSRVRAMGIRDRPISPGSPWQSSGISRRTLVSTLAALPVLSGTFFSASAQAQTAAGDPLPSWNDGAEKQSIINFVTAVTRDGSPDFVPVPQRIATFDNDGTLWCEQPVYVQLAFALDRVKAMAPLHPEWKDKQPFKAVLDGDMKTLAESGEHGLVELITVTHAGMTTNEFLKIVTDWLATAQHPRFKRPYTELVYQPMLELLAYLRANGFKTFIVSGGGVEFMRPWSERVYGVPPEQVVGSSIKTQFKIRDGSPELFRLPEINFIDDKAGKPVGINEHIGRRPIAAFGNSDGDLEMLQWTTMGGGVRLGLIVHHTDAEREYAYDRNTSFGRLDKALDAAAINKWTVVDMKKDWKVIFPSEKI